MGGREEGAHRLFAKGSLVEVRMDQEGFDGAWYVATIVDGPSEMKNRKNRRRSSSSSRYLVKYLTLFDDDGIEPLIEYVEDFSLMRPSPPTETTDHQRSFELKDIVDAFHRDGWWTGVISRVLDDSKFAVYFHNPPEELEFASCDLRVHHEWVDCKWVISEKEGTEQQRVSGLDNQTTKHTRKRGETKSQVKRSYPPAKGNDGNAGGYTAEELVEKECITEAENPLQLFSEPSLMDLLICQRKKRGRPDYHNEGMPSSTLDELPGNTVNQPLLMYYPTLDDSSVSSDMAANECNEKNQSLPFEKCSPVWNVFECMEVFQVMPQKPHFYPLYDHEEVTREGLAIGHMVTFSSVVERMKKLKFGDPSSIFEGTLKTILVLESHGFDVESLRGRLSELLSKKERQQELQEKSKEVEKEIVQKMQEKTKIEEEICETSKQQMELEKKIELALLISKKKDKEIAALQSKLDVIRVDLQSAGHDFGRLVASPW